MDYWHDSPTFLNRKDTLLLWFSLSELLFLLGIIAVWGVGGLILSVFALGTYGHWIIALSGVGLTVVLIFVRVQGIRLWLLMALTVLALFKRRVYVAEATTLYGAQEPAASEDGASEDGALEGRKAGGILGPALRLAEQGRNRARDRLQDRSMRQTIANEVEKAALGTVRGVQSALREAWRLIMGRGR